MMKAPSPSMRTRTILLLGLVGLFLVGSLIGFASGIEALSVMGLAGAAVLVLGWIGIVLFRQFLWRVGRKLAFSYFLIGVLPIPMVLLLAAVCGYVFAGSLLGHLFRDTLAELHQELAEEARSELVRYELGATPASQLGELVLAYYRDGQRSAGDPTAPAEWPEELFGDAEGDVGPTFVILDQGPPRLVVAARRGDRGVVGVYQSDIEEVLREHSGVWLEIESWDERAGRVQVELGESRIMLKNAEYEVESLRQRRAFFGLDEGEPTSWLDRPILYWGEMLTTRATGEGDRPARYGALLNASIRTVYGQVLASQAEVDTAAWGLLVGLAFLLFDIYAAAVLMALFMIFGLSRAVNRLSKATSAVREGDFSVRIPVKRRDQLGELQRSYNQMAANLEELITTAAQKESIEKELDIARELQQNLLPSSLTTTEAVEFASYFEPSAAIGGDYFDLLKLDQGKLVVVVADVSGHGLSAGLRMAMLKAALVMLVEQRLPASTIFQRLDKMVRTEHSPGMGRPMVTATLALFDPADGTVELTNAGHTPTYHIRDGVAHEIALPSPPLGALGAEYGHHEVQLEPGDLMVWLSDGLLEAVDADDEPFGYQRIADSLGGPAPSAAAVRDRLLAAVSQHCGPLPADDDRTLVVLRYLPATTIS